MRIFIAYVVLVLLMEIILSSVLCFRAESQCGLDAMTKRELKLPLTYGNFSLAAVYPSGNGSVIVTNVSINQDEHYVDRSYISTDHGDSWQQTSNPSSSYSNLNQCVWPFAFPSRDIASRYIPRMLWRTTTLTRLQFSDNTGKSWKTMFPQSGVRASLKFMDLLGTGRHNGISLYVHAIAEGQHGLYRSEDYGRTFELVSKEITYAIESRAESNLMIGVAGLDLESRLAISKDGGKTWSMLQSHEMLKPAVYNSANGSLKTWFENPGDKYRSSFDPVIQIESDPSDAQAFYVLTEKGAYATRDQGQTFRLLPLASEYFNSVDTLAVDPVDGRYLYAFVAGSYFYRSSDKGCTWEKVRFFPELLEKRSREVP
jgi:hypothetical protein